MSDKKQFQNSNWEIVCDEQTDRVRRLRVPRGYLYQVEKFDVEESMAHLSPQVHRRGWHPPVFVADQVTP